MEVPMYHNDDWNQYDGQIIMLNQILKALERIEAQYKELNSVEGKSDGFSVILPVGGLTTKIFFDTYDSPINLPLGTLYKPPYSPLSILKIINEGPADIQYATGKEDNSEDLTQLLRNGEDDQVPSSGKKITNLFMRAITTGNATIATVRIGWVI
jgi:hypothetical protein